MRFIKQFSSSQEDALSIPPPPGQASGTGGNPENILVRPGFWSASEFFSISNATRVPPAANLQKPADFAGTVRGPRRFLNSLNRTAQVFQGVLSC